MEVVVRVELMRKKVGRRRKAAAPHELFPTAVVTVNGEVVWSLARAKVVGARVSAGKGVTKRSWWWFARVAPIAMMYNIADRRC